MSKSADLRFLPETGGIYQYIFEYTVDQQYMDQPMKSNLKATFTLFVTGGEGADKVLKAKYDRFAIDMQSPSGNLSADTDQAVPGAEAIRADPSKMIGRLFHAIKGQAFTIRINQLGQVTAVGGLDSIVDHITGTIIPVDGGQHLLG